MSLGTANNQLKKSLLFHLAQKCNMDICRCKEKIDTLDEFSIEHKENWLDSDDPKTFFFDINNISFSHLGCNVSHGK